MARTGILGFLLAAAICSQMAAGQNSSNPNSSPQNLSPNELVRKVVAHELEADDQDHTHWMYRDKVEIPAPGKTTMVVETREGDLACLDEIGNRPLTAEQRSAEAQRIRQFVGDASAQRKARRASAADDQKSTELFSILPDAFVFRAEETTGDTVKLGFEPNPEFHPHSMEAYVFHKMSGSVTVNTRELRLAEISGTLTKGVEFAGGLLGHLDAGGTFDARQTEVAPGVWKIIRLKVDMRGKVLFFKTIGDQEDETRSDFKQMPDTMTLSQAEQMLLKSGAEKAAGD